MPMISALGQRISFLEKLMQQVVENNMLRTPKRRRDPAKGKITHGEGGGGKELRKKVKILAREGKSMGNEGRRKKKPEEA